MPYVRKKIFGACGAAHFAQNLNLEKDGFKNFGGSGGGRVGNSNRPPPLVSERVDHADADTKLRLELEA